MARTKLLYPYAEQIKNAAPLPKEEEPDMFCGNGRICPNWDKFTGWDTEKVLVYLNID